MPWFRLEDSFDTHPKVIAAGNEAIGLFIRCGTYSARHLTDGFVPKDVVAIYSAGNASLAATLVRVGLWHRERTGYAIHDYLEYNPSKDAVDGERVAKAERQRRWREKARNGNATSPRSERDGDVTKAQPSSSPVDNAYRDAQSGIFAGRSGSRRRVTNASRNASQDAYPTRPAPTKAGRGRSPDPGANGRAGPPGSAARAGNQDQPWCGECDQATRLIGEDEPSRCPRCHPLATLGELTWT